MIVTVYQNNRNENKFIEVKKTGCSHFYFRQYMKWGRIKNFMGNKDGFFSRVTRKNVLNELLNDYTEKGSYFVK